MNRGDKVLILICLACVGHGWRLTPSTLVPRVTTVKAQKQGRLFPLPILQEPGAARQIETTAMLLRMLCQVARVEKGMGVITRLRKQLVQPEGFRAFDLQLMASKLKDDTALLAPMANLQAMSGVISTMPPTRHPQTLRFLRDEADRLHRQMVEQEDQLQALEEEANFASNTTRAREIFELLDTDQDGTLDANEFLTRATLMMPLPEEMLSEIFNRADSNQDGRLDFAEFESLLSTMSRDALGPLRREYASSLARLLTTDLEMIPRTIAVELDRSTKEDDPSFAFGATDRIEQLERYVEQWYVLSDRAENLTTQGSEVIDDGDPGKVSVPIELIPEMKALLRQVRDLAGELYMTNVTTSLMWQASRTWAQWQLRGKGALRFCGRAARIFVGDVLESVCLVVRRSQGQQLDTTETQTLKRTLLDTLTFIPYIIIFLIPLSPVGHAVVFSAMNRYLPWLVPSALTAQRQDIDAMYSRIRDSATLNRTVYERTGNALVNFWRSGKVKSKAVVRRSREQFIAIRTKLAKQPPPAPASS